MTGLTTVKLEGVLGKLFGRTWQLDIQNATEALQMIDCNKPGLIAWIKRNVQKYSAYRIVCTYEDGHKEVVSEDTYLMNRKPKKISFLPVVTGAGAGLRILVGAVLVVAGVVMAMTGFGASAAPYLIAAGVSMMVGGIIEMLVPQPKTGKDGNGNSVNSYYFDGPVNTTEQGSPVPLIYGRVKVGSQAVSASITVDQLM